MAYGTPLNQAREHQWQGPILFRVEAVSYSYVVDAEREEYGSTGPVLEVTGYEVHKWTELGATLKEYNGARRRWVDLSGNKQWASRTIDEAVEQFALRRKRQIYILERQLARARRELDLATARVGNLMPIVG